MSSSRDRRIDRGARLGRNLRRMLGEDLRRARVAADLSQSVVGKTLGWSHQKVGRIERAASPQVSLEDLAKILAIVGMELSARAFPTSSATRDKAHMDLLERFRSRISTEFTWATEVPLPNPGDLRSWDALIKASMKRYGIEAETRPTDWQALERRIHLKERDGGVDGVILVLRDTRSNRAFVRENARAIAASFPIDRRAAMAALGRGDEAGGNALVLI